MPVFDHLIYWNDALARKGSENMAVDHLLLEQVAKYPILRVYAWSEPSVSFGYFHRLEDVKNAYPSREGESISYVRRWTGGGIVDHRVDLTYTLVVPREFALGHARGASSYHLIHQVLREVLKKLGQKVELSRDEGGSGVVCFDNPVAYDLTDQTGQKIAGAGQRRTRHGLLHQGSVLTELDADVFGKEFAEQLATSWEAWNGLETFEEKAAGIEADRYATSSWLEKR